MKKKHWTELATGKKRIVADISYVYNVPRYARQELDESGRTGIVDECHTTKKFGVFYTDNAPDLEPDLEPDLGPTHYNCCHAPKDQGHMFGCPHSTENKGSES